MTKNLQFQPNLLDNSLRYELVSTNNTFSDNCFCPEVHVQIYKNVIRKL